MSKSSSSIGISLSVDDKNVKSNLAAIGESVKRLGLMTETAFSKQNMGALGVKNFADVRAEMAKLTKAYRDLKDSGKASTGELAKALESLRTKQRELYATISNPPKLDMARSVLGVSSHSSIVSEINKVKTAYAQLARSGKLSMGELAQAKVALGRKIDDLRNKTNGWRDSLGQIKGKAVEAATAGAGIYLAAKAGIDFESAMADVRKVVDGTPDEIAAIGVEMQNLSRKIPLTAIELAKIAAAGGQLGIAAKDISPFVEITAKMATAFDMTADEAGIAIGKLKNVFGLSIPEIGAFGDAINQLGNTSAAREKDIVDVMLRVGGTSQQFGLAKEKTAALAAAFLSLGKTPETASTAINTLLNRMQTATMQSGEFQDALGKIGISAEDMAISVEENPQQALTNLLETLAKLDGKNRAEVLTGLFGREFQDDIGVLVGGLQTYRDTLKQVGDENDYAGAMLKEFKSRAATTGNQLVLLKNVFIEIATNVGTGFLPIVKQLAQWATTLLKPIADLTGAFPKMSAAIVGLGTGALVFKTVATAVNILKMGISSFGLSSVLQLGKVGTAVQSLGTVFKLIGGRIIAPFLVGWEIGSLLNKFDVVQKAGIAMAGGITNAWLKAKLAWASLTGGDTEGVKKEIAEADRIYSEMFANVGKEAKESATVQKQAQKEVTSSVTESASTQKRVQGEALSAMKAKYQEYAAEVKRLQDDISGRERSLYEQLRDMARSGMSDVNAWEDLKKQAEEYEKTAKAAADSGDFNTAITYADKAKDLYAQLNTEVKEGDTVLVSQAEALKTAMAGVESAGKISIDALKAQQEAAHEAMNALTEESGFQNLREGMDAAEKQWLDNWETMRAEAISDINAVEDRLSKIKDKNVTVWVNEKVRKAMGGMVQRLARGGKLSGYGGGDRISALLEAGEFVVRKEAVARFGADFFYRLNSLQLPDPAKMAIGGMAGGQFGSGSGTIRHEHNLRTADGNQATVYTDDMNAAKLIGLLRRAQVMSS